MRPAPIKPTLSCVLLMTRRTRCANRHAALLLYVRSDRARPNPLAGPLGYALTLKADLRPRTARGAHQSFDDRAAAQDCTGDTHSSCKRQSQTGSFGQTAHCFSPEALVHREEPAVFAGRASAHSITAGRRSQCASADGDPRPSPQHEWPRGRLDRGAGRRPKTDFCPGPERTVDAPFRKSVPSELIDAPSQRQTSSSSPSDRPLPIVHQGRVSIHRFRILGALR